MRGLQLQHSSLALIDISPTPAIASRNSVHPSHPKPLQVCRHPEARAFSPCLSGDAVSEGHLSSKTRPQLQQPCTNFCNLRHKEPWSGLFIKQWKVGEQHVVPAGDVSLKPASQLGPQGSLRAQARPWFNTKIQSECAYLKPSSGYPALKHEDLVLATCPVADDHDDLPQQGALKIH
jgi:hypothetical protein